MKKILFGTVGVVILGIGIFAYGNMPQKTYYPNGALKSEVNQSFFQKNGLYKEYDENGKLKLEVLYQNGIKTGLQKEYFPNGSRLESHYQDGKKEGRTTLSLSPKQEYFWTYHNGQLSGDFKLDEIIGTIDSKGNIVYTLPAQTPGTITGRFVCQEEQLVNALLEKNRYQQQIALAKCLVVEHMNFTDKTSKTPISVSFDGAFHFPKFVEQSTLRISSSDESINQIPEALAELGSLPKNVLSAEDIQYYLPHQLNVIVQNDNQHVQLELLNNKQQKIQDMQFNLVDIALLIDGISQIGVSNPTVNQKKLFETVKQITFNQFNLLTPNGQKDMQFNGAIRLLTAQANTGSRLDIFNPDEKSVVGLEATDAGFSVSVSYPMSAQKMISFEVITVSPYLNKLRAALEKASSFEAYAMTLFNQQRAISLTTIPTVVQKIIVRNLVFNDVNGNQLVSAQNVIINPFNPEQQILGDVQFNKTPQEYVVVHFRGNPETIQVEKSNGEKINTTMDDLPLVLNDYIIDDLQKNTWEAFLSQAEQVSQSEKPSSLRHFCQGFMSGYLNQMNDDQDAE